MQNKKGVSNLEMIVSFLIFTGFIFAFFLMFPITSTEKSKVGLDAAERGVLNFTSMEMIQFSIDLKVPGKCFIFDAPITLEKIIVKNQSNALVNATYVNGKVQIDGIDKFYYIFSSSEFQENGFGANGCTVLDSGKFELGLVKSYTVLSWASLQKFKEAYSLKYNELRAQFNIPAGGNFGVTLRDTSGNEIINATKTKPIRASVLARETPVQIAYSNGELKYALLHIENW